VAAIGRRRWVRIVAVVVSVPLVILCFAIGYYYVSFASTIDKRLHGERERVLPQVFARPLELRRGQALSERQLIDRLNDLGYTERQEPARPGEFAVGRVSVTIRGRSAELTGRVIRVSFQKPAPPAPPGSKRSAPPVRASDRVERLELDTAVRDRIVLDAPLLTSIINGEREKRAADGAVGHSGADHPGGAGD